MNGCCKYWYVVISREIVFARAVKWFVITLSILSVNDYEHTCSMFASNRGCFGSEMERIAETVELK
jgi:hypothetical protein